MLVDTHGLFGFETVARQRYMDGASNGEIRVGSRGIYHGSIIELLAIVFLH